MLAFWFHSCKISEKYQSQFDYLKPKPISSMNISNLTHKSLVLGMGGQQAKISNFLSFGKPDYPGQFCIGLSGPSDYPMQHCTGLSGLAACHV